MKIYSRAKTVCGCLKQVMRSGLFLLMLVTVAVAAAQAQDFTYTNNNGLPAPLEAGVCQSQFVNRNSVNHKWDQVFFGGRIFS
jgi:hypothetical protein